ncbi:MAG TPA: DUF4157 domain-containing protein [Kofleriaceae bacterium]|jgi:hypothetical protein|nr:DUF4157 domain-containing protein [Kofleriaceae bacterium]
MPDYADRCADSHQAPPPGPSKPLAATGKQTLVEQIAVPAAVQRSAPSPSGKQDEAGVHAAASRGIATPASPLPHGESIQRMFGRHDISQVQAHAGPEATDAARTMGAAAYATGNHVVLGDRTDLHTVAHEAAHVVQQRGGVQLKGGVGTAGDAYERHADAVADRVVAGHSAEDLLDRGTGGGTGGGTRGGTGGAMPAVQRREGPDDATILGNQASLKNTDIEIPALEGALLATRQEAMTRGLLSRPSYDAALALSQAMTQLQPAVAARGSVDRGLQSQAANAARQLFAALQRETADEHNFRIQPSTGETSAITSRNPYTDETRVTTYFFAWIVSQTTFSGFEHLPELIGQGQWADAFRGYRALIDGLDLWVADQLRKTGRGTRDEALGNAQEYHAQLLTGLEQIAGKHAQRLPALFHPDPHTVQDERAAGHPVAETVPLNVYVWRDEQDGKFHIYDLTTPGHPQEQAVNGPPTAAMMNTFFEEVARYPKGAVHYTLPAGGAGVAPTTGKIKWYEWAGYAGLVLAGVGLALFTGGASVAATVCFAAGAIAGGASAAGHLVDTAHLGTATTATVVLDVAQIAASFASFGALSITVRAGGVAAALASSRAFVPLLSTAAAADGVQLVALTDITLTEINKIQNNAAGSAEDKQRAISILLTQLVVTGGLTVLSVRGVRDVRALAGRPLELVEQNGATVLRVAGEGGPEPVPHRGDPATDPEAATAGNHPNVTHEPAEEVAPRTPGAVPHPGGPGAEVPALPRSWDKFDPANNAPFRTRLNAFRGSDNLAPDYSGGEGRVFAADGQLMALKRWFRSRLGDMAESLSKLRQVRADVEANPRLSADVDVVRIYEEGPDWILRAFDPNSVELKSGPAEAQAARARAIAELEAQRSRGGLSPMLADLLGKLRREPPSANLHWSPSRRKILVIDMQ